MTVDGFGFGTLTGPSCGNIVHGHTVSAWGGWGGGGDTIGGGGGVGPDGYGNELNPLTSTQEPCPGPRPGKRLWSTSVNVGAPIIRIGFWGPLYHNYDKDSPKFRLLHYCLKELQT